MNFAKYVWNATTFSFIIGAVVAFCLCITLGTNLFGIYNEEAFSLGVFVALVMGFIYFIIQMSLSSIVKCALDKSEKSEMQDVWRLCIRTIFILYVIVFSICEAITGFDFSYSILKGILIFSIPYLINCLIFVFRLHYLCWKDLKMAKVD